MYCRKNVYQSFSIQQTLRQYSHYTNTSIHNKHTVLSCWTFCTPFLGREWFFNNTPNRQPLIVCFSSKTNPKGISLWEVCRWTLTKQTIPFPEEGLDFTLYPDKGSNEISIKIITQITWIVMNCPDSVTHLSLSKTNLCIILTDRLLKLIENGVVQKKERAANPKNSPL